MDSTPVLAACGLVICHPRFTYSAGHVARLRQLESYLTIKMSAHDKYLKMYDYNMASYN